MTESPPPEPVFGPPEPVSGDPPVVEPAPTPPEAPPRPGRNPAAVLGAIGFLLVVAALAFLWQRIQAVTPPLSADAARVSALEAQMHVVQHRLDVLERRPAAPAAAPSVDLGSIKARLAALEHRQAAAPAADNSAARVDTLEQRLARDEARVTAATARTARLQQAALALAAGEKLGNIPDAPAALARFANVAPPTEAALRLAFPEAARRAEAASVPATGGLSIGQRMWLHVESLVTVREGDKMIVGPPAAETLAAAQTRLDAGDLAGCVAALGALDAPAAAAMAPWVARARALLEARAALATLARG